MSDLTVISYRLIVAGGQGSREVPANRRLAACPPQKLTGWAVVAAIVFVSGGCKQSREDAHAREVATRFGVSFCMRGPITRSTPWGHDALKPLSKTSHDWYGQSLLMTPVDALDTLILMKLDEEAAKTKKHSF